MCEMFDTYRGNSFSDFCFFSPLPANCCGRNITVPAKPKDCDRICVSTAMGIGSDDVGDGVCRGGHARY